jgi:hypothetical protein
MRKIFALVATCSFVASPAARAEPPPLRGNSPTAVLTEHEQGTFLAVDRTNPCTGANDLTIVFDGRSFIHVTEKVAGGFVEEARVLASESGTFTTAIGGVVYSGRVSFSSRVIMNRQNSNFAVQEWIRATSPSGDELRFHVLRLLVFSAANVDEPVVSMTRVSAVGCPAGAATTTTSAPAPPTRSTPARTQRSVSPRILPRRRHA